MESTLERALDHLVSHGKLSEESRGDFLRGLLEREQIVSTAIGHAVAIPHCYLDVIDEPLIVFIRLKHPINMGAPDGIPTHFIFLLLGNRAAAADHLDVLAGIARLMSNNEFRYELGEARDGNDLLRALDHATTPSTPIAAPAQTITAGLQFTGRFAGGLVADVKRRLPHFRADFVDGLHFKSVSSTLFLLFACLAPAITFGGIMAELTNNHIGAVEMIAASAFCGVAYALFSGQPLIILGGTGPLLLFEWILFRLCGDYDVDFLATRAWVGLWSALLLGVLAVTDAGCLMRFFTRFTDEIFAALISVIFIFAAVEALAHTFLSVYAEQITSHDRALVPLILALGTFFIAMSLTRFRRSRYLLAPMREFLADFGPSIALGCMLFVAVWWFHDVDLATLPAPESFRPTLDRDWLVNLSAVDVWLWFAAIGPALFVTVLVFVDQNITARLVNSPDHKLTKGEAFHYDLALIAVLISICSIFGLPWL
ncbi:MAG: PTS sugar transporter subunit IIA, partial [Planctomycetota bacterium]|nr:PTS sugar transporter subunit IIA [Planctomycetota bacterium]